MKFLSHRLCIFHKLQDNTQMFLFKVIMSSYTLTSSIRCWSTSSTIVHTLSFLFSTMPFSAFLPILGLVYFWLICSSYRFLKLILSLLYLCVCVSFQYVLKNRSSYFLSTQIHKHFLSCFALLVPVLRNVSLISDQIYLPIFSSKTLIFAFHICL